jgi:multiple sugar transport system substrate-binding protein
MNYSFAFVTFKSYMEENMKKNLLKKIIPFIILTLLTVPLTACSGTSNKTADDSNTSDASADITDAAGAANITDAAANEENDSDQIDTTNKINLTIWWMSTPEQQPVMDSAISQFEAKYPNITITPEYQPSFDDTVKLQTAFIGETAPDILKTDFVNIAAFADKQYIANLTDLGADSMKDKFITSTWDANLYNKATYGLPMDANTIAFFSNKTILDKAGQKVPTTYAELEAVGKAINGLNLSGVSAYTVPISTTQSGWLTMTWLSWLWRNGGDVLSPDLKTAAFNSDAGLNALQQMMDLINKDNIVPPMQYLEGDFYTGSVGMIDMGCWNLSKIENNQYGEFEVTAPPALKDGVPASTGLGLYSMVVSSQSKHPKEAYAFIKFLTTNSDLQLGYCKTNYFMPSLQSVYDDAFYQTPDWQVFKNQLEIAKTRPAVPQWPDISDAISSALEQVLTEGADPKQALDDAATLVDQILTGDY